MLVGRLTRDPELSALLPPAVAIRRMARSTSRTCRST